MIHSDLPSHNLATQMEITYKKLWHMLIDKGMTKTDLQKAARLSWSSIAKLNRGDNISTDLLLRICNALNCNLTDIVETVEVMDNRRQTVK